MSPIDTVVCKARAKINLALDIMGRRPDGYHTVRMIMQTLKLHDTLTLKKTKKPALTLTCDSEAVPTDDRNIAYRAASYILKEYNVKRGVEINLIKRIPVAAGLAGGSADCAAVIKGLNALFNLKIPTARMLEIGALFGADVPFCVLQGTMLAEGAGEKLTRLPPHPECFAALARPPSQILTGEAYEAFDNLDNAEITRFRPDIPKMTAALKRGDLKTITASFGNVLAAVTTKKEPLINELTGFFVNEGALGAMMSGSGPCVFAYFTDRERAQKAITVGRQRFPNIDEWYLTKIYNKTFPLNEGRFT